MKIYAFIGDSGTGKSYNAARVAKENNIDYIIDDGLLICKNKILAGTSAKKEPTLVAAIKKAIFQDPESQVVMKKAISEYDVDNVLILGTSVKMVEKIRNALELPDFTRIIRIEEIATSDEISKAKLTRQSQGKHVIPVPVMEIRKTFSGYFLDPLRVFRKSETHKVREDKSIVRPTYSYLGDFTINDTVLYSIATYETRRCHGIDKVTRVSLDKQENKVIFNIEVTVFYGENIKEVSKEVITTVKDSIEKYASVYIDFVNLTVKSLTLKKQNL